MYYLKPFRGLLMFTPRSLTRLNSTLSFRQLLEQMLMKTGRYNNMAPSAKAPAGHFTILYFASASSFTSKDSEHLSAPLPLSKLFETLEEKYSGITAKVLSSCMVTLNLEYVDMPKGTGDGDQAVIKEGDEVAIIPPVSSG